MKKILLGIIFLTTLLYANNMAKLSELKSSKTICKDNKALEFKQRGCCSWHGGVSGCSGGRVTCNDGSYSPSCTCVIPVSPLG